MSKPDLRAIVNFEQSFVGGPVGEGPVNATNWMYCFHGDSECVGHATMLCSKQVNAVLNAATAARHMPPDATDVDSYAWFDMVTCMNCGGPGYNLTSCEGIEGVTYGTPKSIPQDAKSCANSVGLGGAAWDAIDECVLGVAGRQLLHDSHFNTMKLFAAHGSYTPTGHGYRPPLIPVVWVEGKQYNNPLVPALNPYKSLAQKVCDAFTGSPKPDSCDSV